MFKYSPFKIISYSNVKCLRLICHDVNIITSHIFTLDPSVVTLNCWLQDDMRSEALDDNNP